MTCNSGLCTSGKKWIKTSMKTPIHFNNNGMKSSLSAYSTYDRVISWATIIVTCIVIINVYCTIYVQIESTMTTFIKVWKPYLIIRISIRHWVWWKMCSTLQINNCNSIPKCIVGCNMFIPRRASKEMDT
jgi:hypothetical protein